MSLLALWCCETRKVSSFHFIMLYMLTFEVAAPMALSASSHNDVASFPCPSARALAHLSATELIDFRPASSTSDCNNNEKSE